MFYNILTPMVQNSGLILFVLQGIKRYFSQLIDKTLFESRCSKLYKVTVVHESYY